MTDIYDFTADTLEGRSAALGDYKGKAMLIVNVASKCGFTPQYQGLEALSRKLSSKGLVVLGFPCDQFGHQEPGAASAIREFCSLTYDVTFPMFAKIEVNGSGAHPLYKFLKSQAKGIFGTERIKWNFTKFLVDTKGRVVARYAPTAKPQGIERDVEALLTRMR